MTRSDTPARAHPQVVRLPRKDDEEIVGLRSDDLSEPEQRRLASTLSTRAGAKDRESAMTLARAVGELRAPRSDLHAGHVLEAVARRRRSRRLTRFAAVGIGVAVVAAGALAIAGWATTRTWDRTHFHVTIEANALHDGQELPVWRRAEIPAESDLTLAVTTTGPGTLFVRERWGYGQVQPIAPTTGRWEVEAGEHPVIGPVRPDHVPLDVRYEAWLCPPETQSPSIQRCRIDKVDVRWR